MEPIFVERSYLDRIRKKFSVHFKECLKKRYKKIPSTNFIANEFNLRAHDTETVSREAVRKCLNGVSLPKPDKLSVMGKWLDLKTELFEEE